MSSISNPIEGITLKHLAPYLPCGVNVSTNYHQYSDKYFENKFSIPILSDWDKSRCDVKLHLRPLSDLTKEIEVNGERFVPMVELLKMKWTSHDLSNDEIEVSADGYPHAWFKYCAGREIRIYPHEINWTSRWMIEKLYEWHFDVEDLIGRGLAININDIQK